MNKFIDEQALDEYFVKTLDLLGSFELNILEILTLLTLIEHYFKDQINKNGKTNH